MQTGYSTGGTAIAAPVANAQSSEYYDVTRLRRQFLDYIGTKRSEITEQKESRRYYHGSHWTAKELEILRKRNQPPTTYNRVARKINSVVGWIERLRQDPKAYPRTPEHEQGAEVASATLRYVLDHNEWKGKSPICARHGAVDGIGGVEYNLVTSPQGDPDLELHIVDPDTFFYDPRSFRDGFSDCRYMGVSKWVDIEQAKEIVPEKAAELDDLVDEGGSDLTSEADREVAWVLSHEKKIRLVDHWYIHNGQWCWALYAGDVLLKEGHSPFTDDRGKSFPKYRMFSGFIDHDGDRYGFVRNLKSAQDGLNHRISKALHSAHSRRLIIQKGAVDDIEIARREWAKADGIVEVNLPDGVTQEDQSRDIAAMLEFMKADKEEIENFGPNPAMVGEGLEDSSGRAIQLLQQAGIAELGPYLLAFKSWKTRVYRDIWNIIQQHWKAERWIRVTDDHELAQFFVVNKLTTDPMSGMPVIQNALGQLDVDIIMDEGPDTVNMQADSYGVLQSLGPQFIQQFPEVALSLAPLQGSVKKQLIDKINSAKSQPPPPDPKVMAMEKQFQLEAEAEAGRAQREQAKIIADANLKREIATEEAMRKREEAEANLVLKAREQDMDYEHKRRDQAADYEHETRKQAMTQANERQRQDDDFHHETRKHEASVEAERTKAATKVDGEKQVRKAQTSEPLIEANLEAIKGMVTELKDMTKALTAPKRIVKDKDGRPIGVETAK